MLSAMPALAASMSVVTRPAAAARAVQTASAAQVVNVGVGRLYTTLQQAMDAVTDASALRPYVILLDPGIYDLAAVGRELRMKPFVSITGLGRSSAVILTSDRLNIRPANNSAIQSLTIVHRASSGAGAVQCSVKDLTDFFMSDVAIQVGGNGAALLSDKFVARCELRNMTIVTEAVGLSLAAGGFWYLHDVNIHLTGEGGDHVGITADRYCRIYVFGGKIGTGYGYAAVSNPIQSVIGVLTQLEFRGRIVLHGVWSICRNDGAPAGVAVSCVYVSGPQGWVRLFGGYFQAENPSGAGGRETLSNPGGGKVEIYGSRCRDFGAGPVYSTNQIGRRLYTVADHGLRLEGDMGGLCALDASGGPFTLQLPSAPGEGAQFIFKKIDHAANAVTVSAGGRTVDGVNAVDLAQPYALVHLRYAFGQFLIVA